jgi:hypothetical protein
MDIMDRMAPFTTRSERRSLGQVEAALRLLGKRLEVRVLETG